MIKNFNDFCAELRAAGFSLGGGNAKGIYAAVPYSWENQPEDAPVKWHTGCPDTDPWEWRMRVLEECDDIAYGKVFFGGAGFITAQWYSRFSACRRPECEEEAYLSGNLSAMAHRLYTLLDENGALPTHLLKKQAGITKQDGTAFERALTQLQMKMYITITGRKQKRNALGMDYGWNSTVFTTAESFWAERGVQLAQPNAKQAYDDIFAQVLRLNPQATEKDIIKFILG